MKKEEEPPLILNDPKGSLDPLSLSYKGNSRLYYYKIFITSLFNVYMILGLFFLFGLLVFLIQWWTVLLEFPWSIGMLVAYFMEVFSGKNSNLGSQSGDSVINQFQTCVGESQPCGSLQSTSSS